MDNSSLKTCPACGISKRPDAFYRNRSKADGLSSYCRLCHPRKADPEKQKKAKQRNRAKSPNRPYWLWHRYKLTTADYDRMKQDQGGVCAICGIEPDYDLYVDHCHRTGKVRGLLCCNCNTMLGKMDDDPSWFKQTASYLQETST